MTVSLATTVGIVGLWLSHMVPDVGWCCSQIVQPDQLRMLALWASGFHIWCPTVVDAEEHDRSLTLICHQIISNLTSLTDNTPLTDYWND